MWTRVRNSQRKNKIEGRPTIKWNRQVDERPFMKQQTRMDRSLERKKREGANKTTEVGHLHRHWSRFDWKTLHLPLPQGWGPHQVDWAWKFLEPADWASSSCSQPCSCFEVSYLHRGRISLQVSDDRPRKHNGKERWRLTVASAALAHFLLLGILFLKNGVDDLLFKIWGKKKYLLKKKAFIFRSQLCQDKSWLHDLLRRRLLGLDVFCTGKRWKWENERENK